MENAQRVLKVMVYSDDQTVRQTVRTALGRKPAEYISDVDIFEVATEPAVIKAVDSKAFDLINAYEANDRENAYNYARRWSMSALMDSYLPIYSEATARFAARK